MKTGQALLILAVGAVMGLITCGIVGERGYDARDAKHKAEVDSLQRNLSTTRAENEALRAYTDSIRTVHDSIVEHREPQADFIERTLREARTLDLQAKVDSMLTP